MNTYIAYFNGDKKELTAENQYAAVLQAREIFKVPKSKQGLLSVVLVHKAGKDITHSTSSI